ncbi:MAG: hypothetical protein M1816_001390 [Peltula sp. TS41687]|nr:MAG: hypothetical protein M1816_001390 [Peltula sp. TS41687]
MSSIAIERDGSTGAPPPRSTGIRTDSTRQQQQHQHQHQQDPSSSLSSSSALMSSAPLELSRLDPSGRSNNEPSHEIGADERMVGSQSNNAQPVDSSSQTTAATTVMGTATSSQQQHQLQALSADTPTSSEDPLTRRISTTNNISALGGNQDPSTTTTTMEDIPVAGGGGSVSPTLLIILLLSTTGARHPYRIDDKYLKKQNIHAPGGDPFEISIYTLKELILREWRDEWEARPSNPSSIRLIHFGRLLDDKAALKDCRFNPDSPNVVHMTVRPQELMDEEDAKNTKQGTNRDRDGRERSAGCRCEIL